MHLQYIPELKDLPPILDFEASSLVEGESYPISAGLVVAGQVHYWIIQPEPHWTTWDKDAQAAHGLSREYIVANGIPRQQVYQELTKALAKHEAVYSDNPYWEYYWLECLGPLNTKVESIISLLETSTPKFFKQRNITMQQHGLQNHHAADDAVSIAYTALALMDSNLLA